MTKTFEIGLHTVILLVGPTQSGKSTWANIFQQKIKTIDSNIRCPIISSDELRRDILGQNFDRYDKRMSSASSQAFDLIRSKLLAYTSFPINNEFVIVDSTGLNEQFRFEISQLAKENSYRVCLVMFDYNTSDYFNGVKTGNDREIVSKQVDIFKKNVLPKINRKNYDFNFSIKEKSNTFFSDLKINVSDYSLWKSCSIDSNKDVIFIGDIHEHVSALKDISKIIQTEKQIVFLGDYLDKGLNTAEIIPLIEDFINSGAKMIIGNHESYVARRLKKEISSADKEQELFTSLQVLQKDPILAERFLQIYNQSLPYVHYSNEHIEIYATHAPCQNKFLGKLSVNAKKFQRNFYFKGRSMLEMSEELEFMNEKTSKSLPFHVFGHVANSFQKIEINNKIWLDTGAVYGGKLSALHLIPNGHKKIIQVPCLKLTEGELFSFVKEEFSNLENLTPEKKKQTI